MINHRSTREGYNFHFTPLSVGSADEALLQLMEKKEEERQMPSLALKWINEKGQADIVFRSYRKLVLAGLPFA